RWTSFFDECLAVHTEDPADGRLRLHASPLALKPHHSLGLSLVMLYGGLRLGEACTTQQLTGNMLFVDRQRRPDGHLASSKTTGPVVLPDWLAKRYEEHDFERAANTVYVGIRRAGRRAQLELRPHMLRHAFATNLVAAGATPEVLRRQMRHHDVAVSLRYYVQTTTDDVAATVLRMDIRRSL
ncbi:tyrosine-type recombinase/integrase, partial [Nocardioides currus]